MFFDFSSGAFSTRPTKWASKPSPGSANPEGRSRLEPAPDPCFSGVVLLFGDVCFLRVVGMPLHFTPSLSGATWCFRGVATWSGVSCCTATAPGCFGDGGFVAVFGCTAPGCFGDGGFVAVSGCTAPGCSRNCGFVAVSGCTAAGCFGAGFVVESCWGFGVAWLADGTLGTSVGQVADGVLGIDVLARLAGEATVVGEGVEGGGVPNVDGSACNTWAEATACKEAWVSFKVSVLPPGVLNKYRGPKGFPPPLARSRVQMGPYPPGSAGERLLKQNKRRYDWHTWHGNTLQYASEIYMPWIMLPYMLYTHIQTLAWVLHPHQKWFCMVCTTWPSLCTAD